MEWFLFIAYVYILTGFIIAKRVVSPIHIGWVGYMGRLVLFMLFWPAILVVFFLAKIE